jgi:hypothetical protein
MWCGGVYQQNMGNGQPFSKQLFITEQIMSRLPREFFNHQVETIPWRTGEIAQRMENYDSTIRTVHETLNSAVLETLKANKFPVDIEDPDVRRVTSAFVERYFDAKTQANIAGMPLGWSLGFPITFERRRERTHPRVFVLAQHWDELKTALLRLLELLRVKRAGQRVFHGGAASNIVSFLARTRHKRSKRRSNTRRRR